tara:strand:- start:61 stop:447 length:387 start_codon:yes stop_codon:yes gene_type:complete
LNIIFFDGVCNLCDSFISFLVGLGLPQQMKIASLQGEKAKELLEEKERRELSSVLYLREGRTWRESTAVLYILSDLKWYFFPLKAFLIIPSFLRDALYRYIAKNRYRWFGKRETCRMPTPAEKNHFLD